MSVIVPDNLFPLNNSIKLPVGLRFARKLPLPHKLGVLERIYGNTLASFGIAWAETAGGVIWKLDLRDATHRWMVYGDYEGPSLRRWAETWLANGGVVIDSGANIGQTVMLFASFPDTRVVAFEPLPNACKWLRECLDQYPDWRVSVRNEALGEKPGTERLQQCGAQSTFRDDWYVGRGFERVEVKTMCLDQVAGDQGIGHIRLWKLDVEGSEPAALRGAENLFRERRIDALFIEIVPDNYRDVVGFLDRHGMALHRIDPRGKLIACNGNDITGTTTFVALNRMPPDA